MNKINYYLHKHNSLVCLFFFITGNDCENLKVAITVFSEDWKSALNNRESIEFKTLESKLLSEVSFLTIIVVVTLLGLLNEAPTALCSVVKHAGSSDSTKEV